MSKRNITFIPSAFDDYEYCLKQEKKLLKKINSLIKSIQRDDPLEGGDKPEPLKANLQGYCSRRINHEHRLVYMVKENYIIIIGCRYHY